MENNAPGAAGPDSPCDRSLDLHRREVGGRRAKLDRTRPGRSDRREDRGPGSGHRYRSAHLRAHRSAHALCRVGRGHAAFPLDIGRRSAWRHTRRSERRALLDTARRRGHGLRACSDEPLGKHTPALRRRRAVSARHHELSLDGRSRRPAVALRRRRAPDGERLGRHRSCRTVFGTERL